MTAPNAPMSAEEVLAVLSHHEKQIGKVRVSIGGGWNRDAVYEALNNAQKGMRQVRASVAAMAEREAAQTKRIAELEQRDMMLTKQTVLYAAERNAWRAKVEALRADAERWQHARRLLTVDDIEGLQGAYDSFGQTVSENECQRADAAIDAARRPSQAGAR